eukprot:m.81406 g.81406  ORF g.81406 m.81406 type:complete len:510 (-) comp17555_c0_seq1:76-1605(-)
MNTDGVHLRFLSPRKQAPRGSVNEAWLYLSVAFVILIGLSAATIPKANHLSATTPEEELELTPGVSESTEQRLRIVSALQFGLASTAVVFLVYFRQSLATSWFKSPAILKNEVWVLPAQYDGIWKPSYSVSPWNFVAVFSCFAVAALTYLLPGWEDDDAAAFIVQLHMQDLTFGFTVVLSLLTVLGVQLPTEKYLKDCEQLVRSFEAVCPGTAAMYSRILTAKADGHQKHGFWGLIICAVISSAFAVVVLCIWCFTIPFSNWRQNYLIQDNSCADSIRHHIVTAVVCLVSLSVSAFSLLVGPLRVIWKMWTAPISWIEECGTELTKILRLMVSNDSDQTITDLGRQLQVWRLARFLLQQTILRNVLWRANIMICVLTLASIEPGWEFLRDYFTWQNYIPAQVWLLFAFSLSPLVIGVLVWTRALKLREAQDDHIQQLQWAAHYARVGAQEDSDAVHKLLHGVIDAEKDDNMPPRVFWMAVTPWRVRSIFGAVPLLTAAVAFYEQVKKQI